MQRNNITDRIPQCKHYKTAPRNRRRRIQLRRSNSRPALRLLARPQIAPVPVEFQHDMADASKTASIADLASAIDAAIVPDNRGPSIPNYSGVEYPSPLLSASVSGTLITPMRVFSKIRSQQHVTKAVDVPSIIAAIDGTMDDTIDNAIRSAICDSANLDSIDLPPVHSYGLKLCGCTVQASHIIPRQGRCETSAWTATTGRKPQRILSAFLTPVVSTKF